MLVFEIKIQPIVECYSVSLIMHISLVYIIFLSVFLRVCEPV